MHDNLSLSVSSNKNRLNLYSIIKMFTAFIHGFTGQQKIDENANESVTCRALKGEI